MKNRSIAAVSGYGLAAGFFLFFFCYLVLYIDPRIIYSCNGFDLYSYVHYTFSGEIAKANIVDHRWYGDHRCILELTRSYLKGIVIVPGGLTGLLATLTVYACHYPVMGALVITAIAWLLYLLFPAFVRRCSGATLLVSRYLPAVFLLAICGRYELNYLFYLIPVLGALTAGIIYQQLSSHASARRMLVFSLLFWPVYWLFQWAALLFALFVFIHEIFRRSQGLFVPSVAAVVNIGLLAVMEKYGVSVENSIHIREFFLPIVPPIIVIAYFPLAALFLNPAAVRLLSRPWPLPALPEAVSLLLRSLIILCIVAGGTVWSMNNQDYRKTRTLAQTLHHLQNGQWEQVLKVNTSSLFHDDVPITNDPLQEFMIHAVDHALYRTGRLGEKMFSYHQASFSPEPLLLFKNTLTYGHAKWAASLDLFMDLGLLNLAEKVAGELIECMGPYPSFIYRCAQIQIAKGNNEAAAVYLNKLSRMPFYGGEARRLLRLLNDGGSPASDSAIASLKACMDTSHCFLYQTDEETMLRNLLKRNPNNKMAYEYLMAYYLLAGQLKKIADNIGRAADFGYRQMLPRHWEEALCIYLYEDTTNSPLRDLPLRPETMATLDRYLQAYAPYENDPAKELTAALTLRAEFGETYFYYYTFQVNHGADR